MRAAFFGIILFSSMLLRAGEAPTAAAALPPAEPIPEDVKLEEGFESIFNGKDLTGWEGKDGLWLVEKGNPQRIGWSGGNTNA